nr:LPS export ABC transporter periplasmic protein LptC [Spirochaetales bacterium]
VYTISRADIDVISFTAETASFYTNENRVLLKGVTFRQSSPDGAILTEGTCGKSEINTNTNNIVFEGSVELNSLTEDTRITADRLYWDHEKNLLRGDRDSTVTLYYKDGSRVSGKDFQADGSERVFEFAEVTEGVVRYE